MHVLSMKETKQNTKRNKNKNKNKKLSDYNSEFLRTLGSYCNSRGTKRSQVLTTLNVYGISYLGVGFPPGFFFLPSNPAGEVARRSGV